MTADYIVVLITAPEETEAGRIATTLVEERLAACVNVVPGCRSYYRWGDALQDDREVLMIAKTRRDKFSALEKRVVELHSYDVPEVIAVDITAGSTDYLAFLGGSVSP
ncbi:MAG: divalent-cation tolerance protein CutA [Candidatus Latescibacterota bacterium]|jgi:periplasmic divalent cation tolerance protein